MNATKSLCLVLLPTSVFIRNNSSNTSSHPYDMGFPTTWGMLIRLQSRNYFLAIKQCLNRIFNEFPDLTGDCTEMDTHYNCCCCCFCSSMGQLNPHRRLHHFNFMTCLKQAGIEFSGLPAIFNFGVVNIEITEFVKSIRTCNFVNESIVEFLKLLLQILQVVES